MTETGMNEMQTGAEESHNLLQPTNVDDIEAGSRSIADTHEGPPSALCEGCERHKIVKMKRAKLRRLLRSLTGLLLSLLLVAEAVVLNFWGISSVKAFLIAFACWVAVSIAILISTYAMREEIIGELDKYHNGLKVFCRRAGMYLALSFVMAITSTCVVTAWHGPHGLYHHWHHTTAREECYLIATLFQISCIIMIAASNQFSLAKHLMLETGIFLAASCIIAITVAASTEGELDRKKARESLIILYAVAGAVAVAYKCQNVMDVEDIITLTRKGTERRE